MVLDIDDIIKKYQPLLPDGYLERSPNGLSWIYVSNGVAVNLSMFTDLISWKSQIDQRQSQITFSMQDRLTFFRNDRKYICEAHIFVFDDSSILVELSQFDDIERHLGTLKVTVGRAYREKEETIPCEMFMELFNRRMGVIPRGVNNKWG